MGCNRRDNFNFAITESSISPQIQTQTQSPDSLKNAIAQIAVKSAMIDTVPEEEEEEKEGEEA